MTTRNTNPEFIGTGFAFPLQTDQRGGLSLSTGVEMIEDGLVAVLSTAPGERVMRPTFGCEIWDMLFDPINASTLGRMAEAVRQAVAMWEPRIELLDVTVDPDRASQGAVRIALTYRIKATNDLRNLVYPFYVLPEGGEA